jgi:hypothetical protein
MRKVVLAATLLAAAPLPAPIPAPAARAQQQGLAESYRSLGEILGARGGAGAVGTGGEGAAGVTSSTGVGVQGADAPGGVGVGGGAKPEPEAAADPAAVRGTLPGSIPPEQALGRDVHGPDGRDVAEVEDVLVDAGGSVVAVVLDVGGFLGLGERHVAVPLDALRPAEAGGDGPRLALGMTEDQLRALPRYERRGDSWVRRPSQP